MAEEILIPRRGLMLVLSSPSGAGKSTISRALLETDDQIEMSVSATTRPMRPGEVEGEDYFFRSNEQFDEMIANDEFLEWAHVFGNRYGTLRRQVEGALRRGHDVLFDVDWQGTQALRQDQTLAHLVSVFILPPSLVELERRLRARGTDSHEVIAARMARAEAEISHWAEYDYVLINRNLSACLDGVRTILAAERLRCSRQIGLVDFVRTLTHR